MTPRQRKENARYQTRAASREAQHRCSKCGEKLPDDYEKRCCVECLLYAKESYANGTGRKPSEINGYGCHGSPKWRELEARMAEVCPRCELRGDHVCLPEHADGTARRGPGRLYPDMR